MWTVLSCTEEEKAEARAFEEDQVAGRLKEDVVSMEGRCRCGGSLGLPQVLTPLLSSPLFAARAERQAAEIGGEGGELRGGHLGARAESVSAPTRGSVGGLLSAA